MIKDYGYKNRKKRKKKNLERKRRDLRVFSKGKILQQYIPKSYVRIKES